MADVPAGPKSRRGSNKRLKTDVLKVRVTLAERKAIAAKATELGLTVAEYMRRAALALEIKPRVEVQALYELRRLGALQKHLVNEHPGEKDKFNEVQRDLLQAIKDLAG